MSLVLKNNLHVIYTWWQKWRQRPFGDHLLLLETMGWLGLARFAVYFFSLKRITPYLGKPINFVPTQMPDNWLKEAGRIGWAIRTTARLTPWKSNCLAQGIAGKLMLRRRSIPSTLYLGMAKRQDAPELLTGHAWLRCGALVVTDPARHERFTVIASYSDPDLLQN